MKQYKKESCRIVKLENARDHLDEVKRSEEVHLPLYGSRTGIRTRRVSLLHKYKNTINPLILRVEMKQSHMSKSRQVSKL